MDFNNGLYVFNGVPGLEASKGERIAESLQNLQTKIKHLEQVRNSQMEMPSKSERTDTEDKFLSDVKLKLLFIQVQKLRATLRSTRDDGTGNSAAKSGHLYEQSETEYTEIQNCCKETQTGMSLHEIIATTMHQSATYHKEESRTCFASEPSAPVKEASTSTSDAISSYNHLSNESAPNSDSINSHKQLPSESVQPSSKDIPPHYHFKIDRIPFFLGASSFESHNLIANIQNLIAMLKSHHKSLCGSRFPASQNHASSSVEKSSKEKIMEEISKSLTEIQINQAKLIERLDRQNSDHLDGHQVKDTPQCEKEVIQKQPKVPPNTGSTLRDTTAAARLKENKKPTRAIQKNKQHIVPTNKIRMNLPQVARQRLLRSIREVKTHLAEDDISWN